MGTKEMIRINKKFPNNQSLITNNNIFGFTLIEILVVATIISLLAGIGMVSYSSITKSSLDARRKADIEQIRAAIEMYKSNNNQYPDTDSLTIKCGTPGSIQDETNVYLSQIPSDPKCDKTTNRPNYFYDSSSPYQTYVLKATLEDGSLYTAGPYGAETTTPTPTPTPP